jgi:hypothetical protein
VLQTWNRVSKLPLSLSVGKQANINPSSAGDLFSANNSFSNIKPEPAERRVSASDLASVSGSSDDGSGEPDDDSFFHALLQSRDYVMVLEAYLDESEREGGAFCVAGYVFAPAQARKFAKDWKRLFGQRICHMVDLTHRSGPFKGIAPDEQNRLIKEAVKIINQRITVGIAASCNIEEINKLSPKWIKGFGHAYPVCCHWVMHTLGLKLEKMGIHEDVKYIFEAGHEYQAEAMHIVADWVKEPVMRKAYRYDGHAFLKKSEAVHLQAADLLAWEWTKFKDETHEKQIRPMRKSFRALLENNIKNYHVVHLTGPPLVKFMGKIRDLGLLQLKEERDEKQKQNGI